MKVKELIAALSKLDMDLEVYCYSEDPGITRNFFEVSHIDRTVGERFRDDDGVARMRFDTAGPDAVALISITNEH